MAIGFFLSFPIGMLSTRYRDVAQFVGIAMGALFMLTPVFWRRAQVSNEMLWIVDYNPLTYMLELVRQPLLGHPADLRYWVVSLLILVVSAGFAVLSMAAFRRRVVYWL
jgi:ABC-type polysaccharide/polyol phosphate export permease